MYIKRDIDDTDHHKPIGVERIDHCRIQIDILHTSL